MKALSATAFVISLALGYGAWSLVQPHVVGAGTAVIAQKAPDGKQGGKPYTVLLPKHLTQHQLSLLNFAYEVAVKDGHKHPELVQGIIMQETRAGGIKQGEPWRVAGISNPPSDRYFGIGQIKLPAAKDVMKRFPEMWQWLNTRTDEELQARLIVDDEFNIRMTSKYALIMGLNDRPGFAVVAYNKGQGGAQAVDIAGDDYGNKVKGHAEQLKRMAPAAKR